MDFKLNYSKIYQVLVEQTDLSWGALGVISALIFCKDKPFCVEELKNISSDSEDEILVYLRELKEKDFISEI